VEAVQEEDRMGLERVEDHARRIRHFLFGRSPSAPQQQAQQRPQPVGNRAASSGGGKPMPVVSSGNRKERPVLCGSGKKYKKCHGNV